MEATTEVKMMVGWGEGGGAHTPAPRDKCPTHPPKFLSFVWDWEGAQKCFSLCDQTTGDLKSHHLQAWITQLSQPPNLWVIRNIIFEH